jgi:general secretion pathway protein J
MTTIPPARKGKYCAEAGFTLVELLVALVLLSFVSVALFTALRFGVMAWARGNAQAGATEEVIFTQGFLRRLIENAYPLFLSNDPTHPHVAFEGAPNTLTLLAPTPAVLSDGGLSWFALSVEMHKGIEDLKLQSSPELTPAGGTAAATKRNLLQGAAHIEFGYFGRGRSDRGPQWRERWSGEASTPELVRVRVDFAADDPRLWPEFVVAPRIGVDVGCAYDALTKRCKGR